MTALHVDSEVGALRRVLLHRAGLELRLTPGNCKDLCRFVDHGGRIGAVGALVDAPRLLTGSDGTHVHPRDGAP